LRSGRRPLPPGTSPSATQSSPCSCQPSKPPSDLVTACCLLPTAYCLLLTACY
jgi:hypothetical protein